MGVRYLALAAISCLSASGIAVQYSLTDIGASLGNYSGATSINSAGQVVGLYDKGNTYPGAFVYSPTGLTKLDTLGGPGSLAYSINASGQVVGYAHNARTDEHGFLYSDGTMVDLATLNPLLGGIWTVAYGIGDGGHITGMYSPTDFVQHAFVLTYGSMVDLGTFGGTASRGLGVNRSGQVVGWAEDAAGNRHAFLYSDGGMTDLGMLEGGDWSSASAINDSGWVVGDAVLPKFPYGSNSVRAFLFDGTKMVNLGVLDGTYDSHASDVNEVGQVVGWAVSPYGVCRGFLYSEGAMVDVNDLLDGTGDGWRVSEALSINDRGQIAANAYNAATGEYHAVLLNPVPEPFTISALAVGLASLALRRRRRS